MINSDVLHFLRKCLGMECVETAALHVLTGILLFEFARHADPGITRDLIARNFIARAKTMVRSILSLWEMKDYADCWILHRALLAGRRARMVS